MPKVDEVKARLYGPLARGFGKRVQATIDKLGRTKSRDAMGLSRDQVGKIANELAVPNFAAIAGLAAASGHSLDWFAFAGQSRDTATALPIFSTTKEFSAADDTAHVSRLDEGASLPFSRVWLRRMFEREADQLRLLDAPGNAMEPAIRRHALLIIDLTATRTVDGEIFAFDFGGDHVIRHTQREADGSLMLRADNSSYEPRRLTADDAAAARVIGRVIYIGNPA